MPLPRPPVSRPAAPPATPWHWGHLWLAPHRLAFFTGVLLLMASGLWWAAVQLDRLSGALGLSYAVSPTLTHAAVMVLGFMPLFFAGFLFTAGPKWLGVAGPEARDITPALALQALGWLLWLAGAHTHVALAAAGAFTASLGLALQFGRFWQLWWRSPATDRVHATVVAVGGTLGALCTAGLGVALLLGAGPVALALVHTALWGFVVATYVAVAHRMIPFFTSGVLPMIEVWRPFWVLWLMLGAVVLEIASVWLMVLGWGEGTAWRLLRGALELGLGGVLVWLAWVWGLVQSLKVRLLAMLHVGFVWFGLSLLLSGASQWLLAAGGVPTLGLGALHALTMGFLGSILLAMVTRVACGHSGRALVADATVWGLFWCLQAAVLLRIAGTLPQAGGGWLLAAALLWAGTVLVWGGRLLNWFGRRRPDGRPG
ncbi:NnrS family protein [Hydrogenophaga sp.]|uniref:NnrS family protein n=1 Tax=Hydrogenophaga sp. TaxID=1904254 RepID=UPI00286DB7D6|nr:NnrS family protein [Hydrogenophaga sp.]